MTSFLVLCFLKIFVRRKNFDNCEKNFEKRFRKRFKKVQEKV